MQDTVIEFFCYENDKPIEVQLEPEPITFIVSPQTKLKFVARCDSPFSWAVRVSDGIQVFPESKGDYDITIFENDFLLLNWYKYM